VSDETNPEIQLRLHHERECRRIAELVKAELPEDRGFILMTVTRGPAHADFSSTDYVATVRPQDALRLLHEHMGNLSARAGIAGEPTWQTATAMREVVFEMMEKFAGEPPPNPEPVWRNFSQARKGMGSPEQRAGAYRAMAMAALVELEHLQRAVLKERGRTL
jgi:hypothetical protein